MIGCRAVVALAAAVCAAMVSAAGCATAGPAPQIEPGPTQLGAPCDQRFDGALAALPAAADGPADSRELIVCQSGSWQQFTDPYPSPQRWISSDNALLLHGQGVRNPEFRSGTWTATPLNADAECRVEAFEPMHAGVQPPPQIVTAGAGQQFRFEASTRLATVTLAGNCLWERS